MRRRLDFVGMALLVTAVLSPLPASAQWRLPTTCTVTSQNLFVRDVMGDIYFWYDQIPPVNPVASPSPPAYLEAVRYLPLDARFSYIGARAAEDAFYSESQYIGLGFGNWYVDGALRVVQVFPESPASEIGLARGDRFVEINGQTVEDLAANGLLGGAFGDAQEGVTVEVVYERPTGERVAGTMVKRIITIPTVTATQVYTLEDGRRVGYVFFRNFVQPSVAALDEAFAVLRDARVSELVLDVRYNGGGLVSVASTVAAHVAGSNAAGRVFASLLYNDRRASTNNQVFRFANPAPAASMNLRRVTLLTGRQLLPLRDFLHLGLVHLLLQHERVRTLRTLLLAGR